MSQRVSFARLLVAAWTVGCVACTIGPKPEDPGTPVDDTGPFDEAGVTLDAAADTQTADSALPPADSPDPRDATDASGDAVDGDAVDGDAADGDADGAADAVDGGDATEAG